MRIWTMAVAAAAMLAGAPAHADHHEGDASEAAAVDYADPASWLCLPGQSDACDVSLATTRVDADGTITVEQRAVAEDPPVDCFYVYPTVSNDTTPNSDMIANDEERRVILIQAAPFQQVCRMYAPLYRQVTLTALRRGMATGSFEGVDREMAYNDVKAAWEHYLAEHNDGRGVVLIGHSQGSGVLGRLVAEEIDGQAASEHLVAAYLIGWSMAVPEGADVGGQFQSIPLCREPAQTGCLVNFVSFRSDVPPPAHSRFGRVEGEGMAAACNNPAAIGGGSEELDAWLASGSLGSSSAAPPPWTDANPEIETAFVRVPGLLTGECVSENGFSYLQVTVHGDPEDPRTDTIAGDVIALGQRLDDWGLHLIDMNLVMGDMIAMVEEQGGMWRATHTE